VKPQALVERLIAAKQAATTPGHPGDGARDTQTIYSDELYTAAAQLKTGHLDSLARVLDLCIREIAQARDAANEDQARRRGLA
jgi:hypothetical protein